MMKFIWLFIQLFQNLKIECLTLLRKACIINSIRLLLMKVYNALVELFDSYALDAMGWGKGYQIC